MTRVYDSSADGVFTSVAARRRRMTLIDPPSSVPPSLSLSHPRPFRRQMTLTFVVAGSRPQPATERRALARSLRRNERTPKRERGRIGRRKSARRVNGGCSVCERERGHGGNMRTFRFSTHHQNPRHRTTSPDLINPRLRVPGQEENSFLLAFSHVPTRACRCIIGAAIMPLSPSSRQRRC